VIEPCPGVAGGKRIIFWPARNRLRIGRRPTEADGIHAFQQALADQGHPILGYFSRSKPPKPPTVSSAECLRARREANWLRWPKRTPSGLPSSVSGSRRPRDQKARPSISPRPAALPTRVGKACLTVVSIGIFTQFLDRDQFPSTGHVGFTERCGPFSGKTRPAVILHCHGVTGQVLGGTVPPLSRVGPAHRNDQVVSVSGDPERRPGASRGGKPGLTA
jgi:hypothetical protein